MNECMRCKGELERCRICKNKQISEFLEDLKPHAGMSDYDRFAFLVDLKMKWEGKLND